MSYVCRYNNEKGMSRAEIEATFDILITAGSETTATALTATLYYLLRNPVHFDLLKKEIRSTFKDVSEITMERVVHLNYLEAVIKEGLRIAPPVCADSHLELSHISHINTLTDSNHASKISPNR